MTITTECCPSLFAEKGNAIERDGLEQILERRFQSRITTNHDLNRQLVSFQGNRDKPEHRWLPYREGYSAQLVAYLLDKLNVDSGTIFDPFAGSGTTLFVSQERGLKAIGVELLPSSILIIEVRKLLRREDATALVKSLARFAAKKTWLLPGKLRPFGHLRVTKGAFPIQNELQLERYLYTVSKVRDNKMRSVLQLAAMSVLEETSYTRKDGQYLRWDMRSGRRQGENTFNKGTIREFEEAIDSKLEMIIEDCASLARSRQARGGKEGTVEIHAGSCLELLSALPSNRFSALITSPPYCNRYDYTRTYALELAMLGLTEAEFSCLRQTLLSSTVENRRKESLTHFFSSSTVQLANATFAGCNLLQDILARLRSLASTGLLNNPGIPRMVESYFWEMTLLIVQAAQTLKNNAPFVMVNDNVRYHGIHVPVDLILSDIAERSGLYTVESIWKLGRGKGNSSQQMKLHGRQEVRKCVYVWRRLGRIR